MPRALTFRPGYALATLLLFAVEVCIALFVRDAWVRPYGGDVLAEALVYCGLRAVTRLGVGPAVAVALGIAVLVELGQLIGLLDLLGLRGNRIASVVLGGAFEWQDFLAYALGALAVITVERLRPTQVALHQRFR
ncbi:DUF2809 domain-containing protein [Sphingomonas sp. AOB5]|uniref:ribosomal maturation YjgA family protein n=1 Tax=Sphingomonas sp. AOB5 TaxID=3034017 RepID=UPI0023F637FC|nr:DUF2809 domain-containing protein [Sphingomonas sp. AOB5]MDF7776056.1 DUF2809 domain-containing protein [Sphingomonas sp. AOB5]